MTNGAAAFWGIDPGWSPLTLAEVSMDGRLIQSPQIQTGMSSDWQERLEGLFFLTLDFHDRMPLDEFDYVCFEGYAFGKVRAAHQMGELGGTIRRWLWQSRCENVFEISPSQLKKWATGKGNANKGHVAEKLGKDYDVEFEGDHNLADAFGLAMMATHLWLLDHGLGNELPGYKVKVLEMVRDAHGNRAKTNNHQSANDS